MSEKELTDITLTDLCKEFNSIGDFWEKQKKRESRVIYSANNKK